MASLTEPARPLGLLRRAIFLVSMPFSILGLLLAFLKVPSVPSALKLGGTP